jgi:hypothetical protein
MSDTQSTPPGAAAAKAQEIKEAIRKLDFRDRVIFLGSAALVLLFFFPWWRRSSEILGMTESVSGLHGAGWVGFLAALLGAVAGLTNMGFVPLADDAKRFAKKTAVQLGLAVAALLFGPIIFWSERSDAASGPFHEAGKTIFFWIALLVALATTGAAGWKLADERKKAGGPPA